MAKRDYYMILGVPPTSQPEEIRKAYRMLSKKYHPDLNPDMKSVSDEKMKELVEAYNTLNDSNKRKVYDKQPQFQVRKFSKNRRPPDKKAYVKKPEKKKESLLQKLLAPFLKKEDGADGTPDPRQADVHFTLGLSMAENESFLDQAKSEFQLALKFDSNHKEAAYNYALMCYKLGGWDEARVSFQKVLQQSSDDAYAKKMISLLHDDLM
ncbi:MAG: DnaJ domain-containing protein [Armatimonadetes bacterium]|nr:DnaJ domain-containing protein [Armatimonadota bacterium]